MTASGIATVARAELRLRLRAGRWRLLVGACSVVLLGFTALLRVALAHVTPQELPWRGTVLFGGLVLFALGLALVVVPALAAHSVNGDRERGTLAPLQVTRLSSGEIALGEFVAAWGTSLVLLALTLPLVAYAMTQDGVPLRRALVVLLVLALLLGTVCAVSLFLSAVASTTTSGVLAHLTVFALAVGTVVLFGLATAATTETYLETADAPCPADDPACLPGSGQSTYEATRSRPDRTWWLLAPNPFVVLADAAPELTEPVRPRLDDGELGDGDVGTSLQPTDLDPLGQLGRTVRALRVPPPDVGPAQTPLVRPGSRPPAVWPTGLAADVLLGVVALVLTERRLRTPSRTLPGGRRGA